jgi:hypothetical protein
VPVFGKGHAQTKSWAMTAFQFDRIMAQPPAADGLSPAGGEGAGRERGRSASSLA